MELMGFLDLPGRRMLGDYVRGGDVYRGFLISWLVNKQPPIGFELILQLGEGFCTNVPTEVSVGMRNSGSWGVGLDLVSPGVDMSV